MAENNINLFHGTNVNALPNILKYGMKSVDEQSSDGIVTATGEEWSRINGKRDFISFTEDVDTALDYASFTPKEENSTLESFGVIIGISSSSLKQLKTCRVHSNLSELGIADNIPLEHIKSIFVPEDKVEFVQKLVGTNNIIVTPIGIDERFYYVDHEFGEIYFDAEKSKQLTEKKQIAKNYFNAKEMSEMSKSRTSSGIRGIYEKFKEKINDRGRENGEDTRDK